MDLTDAQVWAFAELKYETEQALKKAKEQKSGTRKSKTVKATKKPRRRSKLAAAQDRRRARRHGGEG